MGVSKLARRRFQRGSLIRSGERWYGRWREDVVINGEVKRVGRKQYLGNIYDLPTKRLALRELEYKLEMINSKSYRPDKRITFADFARQWKEMVMIHHKPSSQSSEKGHVTKWLIPFFGKFWMHDMSTELVQHFISSVPLSPKSIRNMLGTLRMICKTARAWGYQRDNIIEAVMLPRRTPPVRNFFLPEHAAKIIAAAKEPYRTMYYVLAETGIRGGEMCGLKVADIDFTESVLTIRRAAWRARLQTPKTPTAYRRIGLSPSLTTHLTAFLKVGWRDNAEGLLFATRKGTPYDNNNLVHQNFQPLLKKLGLPVYGFHAFRHMNASIMDHFNVPLHIRKERLGHSDISETIRTYTHAIEDDDRRIANEFGRILCPSVTSPPIIVTATDTVQSA